MELDPGLVAVIVGFMVIANRLVAALITPIFEKYELDKFWLLYIAWILAGVMVAFTDVNLFTSWIPNELVGKILTVIVAGGGSNLLHDLTDNPKPSLAVIDIGIDDDETNG